MYTNIQLPTLRIMIIYNPLQIFVLRRTNIIMERLNPARPYPASPSQPLNNPSRLIHLVQDTSCPSDQFTVSRRNSNVRITHYQV